MGSIAMSYSEEEERGSFIAISVNLQAVGCAVGGIIPLIINRDSTEAAGVPVAVYVIIVTMVSIPLPGRLCHASTSPLVQVFHFRNFFLINS